MMTVLMDIRSLIEMASHDNKLTILVLQLFVISCDEERAC